MELPREEFQKETVLIVFGKNIKRAREKKKLGIRQLADAAKYDRGCISALERGEQNLELKTAVNLARVLDVSFPALFSRSFMDGQGEAPADTSAPFYEDDFLLVFAENFKRSLQRLRRSQTRVYVETGVSETAVSRIVRSRNTNPTLQTLSSLAAATDADLCSLFSRTAKEDIL